MDFEKKKKESVDSLNERLYHRQEKFGQRKRRTIHDRKIELKHDFEDSLESQLKTRERRFLPGSFFKKIFFAVLFVFIATAAAAGISLYEVKTEVSEELISMEILGQPFVDGGENLELQVRIQNFNEQSLQLPDLVLSYPKDQVGGEEVFLRRSLQDIAKGNRVNEEFDLVLYGQEGDSRNIHATLEYRIEGSSSIFVKEADHELVIRSTPTELAIQGPKQIVQGQELELEFDFSANTNQQINDVLLKIDFPLGFEFISSSLEPAYGQHTWYFPNMTGERQTLTVTGRVSALPGQGQSFHAEIGRQSPLKKTEIETVFNKETYTVDVQQSFVTADIRIDDKDPDGLAIRGGKEVEVEIEFENTLSKTLADVQVIAHLSGNLYKGEGLRVQNGDYDSNTDRIIWNKGNFEDLGFLEPGEKGVLYFSLPTYELVGAGGSLENPTLSVVVDVSATEINGKVREAFAVSRAVINANSDMSLVAKTLHEDGPFKNDGPIPPRAGKTTKYTLVLQAINSSNEVKETEVKTFLPPYVTWLGNVAPSVERQKLKYNETTRELVWEIGDLKSKTGVGINQPKQVSFQVEILPSLSHVGEIIPLTKDIILSGTDSFTDVKLSYKKGALNTSVKDAGAKAGDARVVR